MGFPPKVDNFLGCFTLETGGLIIGWLDAVLSGIFSVLMIMGIIGLIAAMGSHDQQMMGGFIIGIIS